MENVPHHIPFSLSNIHQDQFATFDIEPSEGVEIGEKTSVGFGVSVADHQIGCSLRFELEIAKNPFLSVQVTCLFAIEEKAWETLQNGKVFVLPCEFARHLVMIVSGTTRGVLYTNTRDTAHSKYFMPLLNVRELISEEVTIEI